MPYQRHSRTFTQKELRADLRRERLLGPAAPDEAEVRAELERQRPRTRADCEDGPRPCPWISCRHHLYVDVTPAGGLRLNFPATEIADLAQSCSLDLADRGGMTLEEVGQVLGLTRERVRQMESQALALAAAAGTVGQP